MSDTYTVNDSLVHEQCWVVRSARRGKLKFKKSKVANQEIAARMYGDVYRKSVRVAPNGTYEIEEETDQWHPLIVSATDDDSQRDVAVDQPDSGIDAGSGNGAGTAEVGGPGGGGAGPSDGQGPESGRDTVQATGEAEAEGTQPTIGTAD